MGDQNLLSRAPPCFGRHVKQLVSAAFAVVIPTPVLGRRRVVKIVAESLLQHEATHVPYRPYLMG
jgi:hypothetical protein